MPRRERGYPPCARAASTWAQDENYYAIEEPTSLNTLELLPQLLKMGVALSRSKAASAALPTLGQVTKVWREAIDHCLANPHRYTPKPAWMEAWTR